MNSAAEDAQLNDLRTAIASYDSANGYYDEVFNEVGARIQEVGTAGKLDIAAVACWKRSAQGHWIGALMSLPDHDVREATAEAFNAETDLAALKALATLPGFKVQGPIATALLCAYNPGHYSVMDRRAWMGLTHLGRAPRQGRGLTLRYLDVVRQLRDELGQTDPETRARDVDKGLYVLGEPPEVN